MKTFKQHLLEVRRNPEQNPHISIYKALEPYKDDPDMFITFTRVNKVGINPKSHFNTPLAVYTYPLKEAWKEYANPSSGLIEVPYAGGSPFVSLLRQKGRGFDVAELSTSEYKRDIQILREYYIREWSKLLNVHITGNTSFPEIILDDLQKLVVCYYFNMIYDKAVAVAKNKTPGGALWSLTRVLAHIIHPSINFNIVVDFTNAKSKFDSILIKEGKNYVEVSIYHLLQDLKNIDSCETTPNYRANYSFPNVNSFAYLSIETIKESGINVITVWNKIFRNILHYEWVSDREGEGIIHPSEPLQAVFFSNKGYDVVGTFDNKLKKRDINIWDGEVWESGTWKGGTWKSGTWLDGSWIKGIWEDGIWEAGYWGNGTWKSGIWIKGIWEDGIWEDGIWKSGTWGNGTWKSGTWFGGTWLGGYDKTGKFHPEGDSPNKW